MKLRQTLALVGITLASNAQGIVVNPDGTHSHVITNGNTSIIVNSNGTHSTAFHNGNTSTIVNPNGTHSTAFRNGNTSIIVNPNGTHSTAFHNGNTSFVLNSNGNTSIVLNDDVVGDEQTTESYRNYTRPWGRGPVIPESAFVDLSQWKSGPVIWVYVKKYRRKRD